MKLTYNSYADISEFESLGGVPLFLPCQNWYAVCGVKGILIISQIRIVFIQSYFLENSRT